MSSYLPTPSTQDYRVQKIHSRVRGTGYSDAPSMRTSETWREHTGFLQSHRTDCQNLLASVVNDGDALGRHKGACTHSRSELSDGQRYVYILTEAQKYGQDVARGLDVCPLLMGMRVATWAL